MNKPLYRERDGVCSRAWMFMGENGGPCDKKCQMCYYAHQGTKVFYSLPTLMQHANLYRHYYGVTACDITGGEPTIYKTRDGGIVELVRHCSNIGLRPSIITHGQNNHDGWMHDNGTALYWQIEDAGLDDWLVSLHGGSAASHDKVLCEANAFNRLVAGLDNVSRPVRFNTTILDTNYKDLPVSVLLDREPTVWNAISFNPFFVWAGEKRNEIDFQVQYRTAAEVLGRAVSDLESAGWEVNVRYFPLCIAREHGFAENVCGYHQVPFDPWEWRLNVTARTPLKTIEDEGGWEKSERARSAQWMKNRENEKCAGCRFAAICDKPPEQYQAKYGLDELAPEGGEQISDPLFFQRLRGKHD